ncbi:MAG TPA: aminoglycoside phosphotransferase family protein [Dehalococcoidia bacterium]|nr:aminoglycoside phosphotransferase family protein [Dehalococcoidia bacterium]
MLEPPPLSEESIASRVAMEWGINVAGVEFLESHPDSYSWTCRVDAAGGGRFFLKLRNRAPDESRLVVACYLAEHGVPEVVAPLRTKQSRLSAPHDGHWLTLFPFVGGTLAGDSVMAEDQWISYGSVVRRVHETRLPDELMRQLRHEDFRPYWSETLAMARKRVDSGLADGDELEREMVVLWSRRENAVRRLEEAFEALSGEVSALRVPFVLCHADTHAWNVMVDADGRLRVIDWDDVMMAPKECDLIFVIGGLRRGLVRPEEEGWFLSGYGEMQIDRPVLAFYRHVRALSDIAIRLETVLLIPGLSPATKRDALDGFVRLFEPGAIVDLAAST